MASQEEGEVIETSPPCPTLAWAVSQHKNSKIPFFSYHCNDEGAANLARGLRLHLVMEEVAYF